jgi:hypothetical protein
MPVDPTSVDPAVTARLLRERARNDSWIIATGSSMLPAIAGGAELRIELASRPPRVGEVWLFVAESNALLAHRFVRRERQGRFVFVGDSAPRVDDAVAGDRLVGRVVEQRFEGLSQPVLRRSGWRPIVSFIVADVRRVLSHKLRS